MLYKIYKYEDEGQRITTQCSVHQLDGSNPLIAELLDMGFNMDVVSLATVETSIYVEDKPHLNWLEKTLKSKGYKDIT